MNADKLTDRVTGDLMTVAETADVLCVSKSYIYRCCKYGLIPHTRMGRRIGIPSGYCNWILNIVRDVLKDVE